MRKAQESTGGLIAWTVGGFVLAVVALFGMSGGFILGLLMLAATPLVVGFLALEAIFGKRPVYITSVREEEEGKELVGALQAAPASVVSMRIIRMEGSCPAGHQHKVGDTWVLNGALEGTTPLCSMVIQMLGKYAERARSNEGATPTRLVCETKQSTVEFELRPQKPEEVAVAR